MYQKLKEKLGVNPTDKIQSNDLLEVFIIELFIGIPEDKEDLFLSKEFYKLMNNFSQKIDTSQTLEPHIISLAKKIKELVIADENSIDTLTTEINTITEDTQPAEELYFKLFKIHLSEASTRKVNPKDIEEKWNTQADINAGMNDDLIYGDPNRVEEEIAKKSGVLDTLRSLVKNKIQK